MDPPKPSTITYRTLANDPAQGQAFQFDWTLGACNGPPRRVQCVANVTSPPNWARNNIVAAEFPVFSSVSYGGTSVRFHRLVMPQFRAFFNAVEVKGLKDRVLTQVGAYLSRTITGRPDVALQPRARHRDRHQRRLERVRAAPRAPRPDRQRRGAGRFLRGLRHLLGRLVRWAQGWDALRMRRAAE